MKKIINYVVASLVLFSAIAVCFRAESIFATNFVNANVEALTDTEYSVYGKCKKQINACLAVCPHCNEILMSVPDILGPSEKVHGLCPGCETLF